MFTYETYVATDALNVEIDDPQVALFDHLRHMFLQMICSYRLLLCSNVAMFDHLRHMLLHMM